MHAAQRFDCRLAGRLEHISDRKNADNLTVCREEQRRFACCGELITQLLHRAGQRQSVSKQHPAVARKARHAVHSCADTLSLYHLKVGDRTLLRVLLAGIAHDGIRQRMVTAALE